MKWGAIIAMLVASPAAAGCPDYTATGKARIQLVGPCHQDRPFVMPAIDVGVKCQNLPEIDPTLPYLYSPGECFWVEKQWLPCLRSRCIAPNANVEPGDWTSPRGYQQAPPGATCTRTWGSP